MRSTRDTWGLALSLASLLGIGLVWLIGWLAAPARHPELARVVLMAAGSENQLSGASFVCRRDPQLAARICVTSLAGRSLALQLAAHGCRARLDGEALSCRLDYGVVSGLPSARIDAPAWTVGTFALTTTPQFDLLGTRSECEWGRIAQASGVLLPLSIAAAFAYRRPGPSTRRQWGWRIFAVLASISPTWIAMLSMLFRWRYLD